uniref:Uncharacterized protein n=1 Tax=Tanacetum cinerariifolium TaxID=118510 RepID=A0A6L2M619_TANCI|nr:hypothetical protein [Tanacetum cinerariifolium]
MKKRAAAALRVKEEKKKPKKVVKREAFEEESEGEEETQEVEVSHTEQVHEDDEEKGSTYAKFGEIEDGVLGIDNATGKQMFVYRTVERHKKALEETTKVIDRRQLQCRQAVDGQCGNKNTKCLPSATSNNNIGNVGFGYKVYTPLHMNAQQL